MKHAFIKLTSCIGEYKYWVSLDAITAIVEVPGGGCTIHTVNQTFECKETIEYITDTIRFLEE